MRRTGKKYWDSSPKSKGSVAHATLEHNVCFKRYWDSGTKSRGSVAHATLEHNVCFKRWWTNYAEFGILFNHQANTTFSALYLNKS